MSNGENNTVDYAPVIADLEAKRAEIDTMIASLKKMQGLAPSGTGGGATGRGEAEVRDDSFFNLNIPEASKKYLGMMKKPQSTPEITDALLRGGMTTLKPDSFANTVGSVLNRMDRNDAGVVKVGRAKWGLAEWYPGRKKGKKQNDEQSEEESEEK